MRLPRHFVVPFGFTRSCLDFRATRRTSLVGMLKWSFHRFATVMFGALLALSISASVAMAGSMQLPMKQTTMMMEIGSSMLEMESSQHQGCDACQPGEEMMLSCPAVCSMPSTGLLPGFVYIAFAASSHRLPLPRATLLPGTTSPPIPGPPRTSYIG